MFNKISKLIIVSFGIFVLTSSVQAVQFTGSTSTNSGVVKPLDRVKDIIGENPSYNIETNETTLLEFIGQIIGVFLGILGTIFIFLTVYAGYVWMTAGGDEKKVEKATHTLKVAIIGLIIIAGSYAIWQFLFIRLFTK